MPATATSFGDGQYGIPVSQTGILVESLTYNYTNDIKTVADRTGNEIGKTLYNEKVTFTINGRLPKTSPFSGTLASSITLSVPLSGYLKGGVTGGLNIIEGITLDYSNVDYVSFKLDGTFNPNISA